MKLDLSIKPSTPGGALPTPSDNASEFSPPAGEVCQYEGRLAESRWRRHVLIESIYLEASRRSGDLT